MRNSSTLILSMVTILLFTACGEEPQDQHTKAIKNPVDHYLDNRVDAMDMAKQSVKESNKRNEERNKAMESLIK